MSNILGDIFGKIVDSATSGGNKYAALGSSLVIGGEIIKNLDDDDKGVDDIAGKFFVCAGRIAKNLGNGNRSKAKEAIEAAEQILKTLKEVVDDSCEPSELNFATTEK